jgi:Glycosyl transferase family 2
MSTARFAVSVCVPAFNGARYIGAALRSVLAQTFRDFELLVVDDASIDGTRPVVEAVRDERVRLVANRFRLGLVANWNRCLELSRGRYVTLFHQDDLMAPENLEAKVRFLEAEPTVGFVHSNVTQIDADGRWLSESWSEPSGADDEGRHEGAIYFRRLLSGGNPVCAPSVLVRRAVFDQVGGFDPRLPFAADWEMWMRIALFHDVGYLARSLVSYRRHGAMETQTLAWSRRLQQGYLAKMLALEKFPERIPDGDALRAQVTRDYQDCALRRARDAFVGDDPVTAGEYLAAALDMGTGSHDRDRTPADVEAVRKVIDAVREGPTTRVEELTRAVADRERTIEAMTRSRAWRTAVRWWALNRAVRRMLRLR